MDKQASAFFEKLDRRATKPVVVATHERSGTHLMIDTLRRQFGACRSWKLPFERNDKLYINIALIINADPVWYDGAAARVLPRVPRIPIKTHQLPPGALGDTRGHQKEIPGPWFETLARKAAMLYVYRDGRDVMTSYYQYRRGFDAEAMCSMSEFLRQEDHGMSRVKYWAHHVRSWCAVPGVTKVGTEALLKDTEATLKRLGTALGMEPLYQQPLLPRPLKSVWYSRRARFFGVRPESSAIVARGEKVKWRQCFTPEDRRFFHDEAGDLLIELGYEASDAWVNG